MGIIEKKNRDYNISGLNYDDEQTYFAVKPQYISHYHNEKFSNKLRLGYDFERYEVSVNEKVYKSDNDLTRNYSGYFFYDTFDLYNITVEAGYRNQYMKDSYKSENIHKDKWVDSYLFMIGYKINKNSNIYIKYDKSFRFPTTDELIEYGGKLNTSLKPQESNTIEAGYKFFYKQYFLNITSFYQKTDNEIFTNPEAIYYHKGFYNTNFDTERIGFNVNAGISNTLYLVDIKYSFIDSSIDEHLYDSKDIPLVSKHTIKGLFSYKTPFYVNVYYWIKYFSPYYAGNDYLNESKRLSSYVINDIKLEYRHKIFEVYIKINNLFKEKYYDYAYYINSNGYYYYPSNGRSWLAGITIRY